MSWKNVQYENDKMRTSEGGGGGSSTFAGLDDVSFNNLQNGQVPKYNSTTHKWENADESGGGSSSADDVTYDNTTSGISATNVQDALDEIAQDFQDGCDIISQAVIAKGQTPASNSPTDIANAISQISGTSFETPLEFDMLRGYVAYDTWYYPDSSTPCDIYEVKNGRVYMLMLGHIVSNRFRAMTTTVDVRTSTESSVKGTEITYVNDPSQYAYVKFTSTINGYLIVGKNNIRTMNIKTYLIDMSEM